MYVRNTGRTRSATLDRDRAMYSQYKPTTQIHTSNLLRPVGKSRGDCDYRGDERRDEDGEGTTEQHRARKREGVGGGDKEDNSNMAGILWGNRIPSFRELPLPNSVTGRKEGGGTAQDSDTLSFQCPRHPNRATGGVSVRTIHFHCVEHGNVEGQYRTHSEPQDSDWTKVTTQKTPGASTRARSGPAVGKKRKPR